MIISIIILALIVAGIQYLFCQGKFMVTKLIPLGAVVIFFFYFMIAVSQPQAEGSPSYALMDMVMGMIFAGVFVGIALGWLMYFNINVSDSEKENKDEDKSEE